MFFGQENAYGVVSGVKNTRTGINQYLQGFLKEENTRFRYHEILFSRTSHAGASKGKIALSYPKLGKKWDGFSFSAEAGQLRMGEVVGIMGRNAIGKSLFVKLLAGAEKNESGEELEAGLKVSYVDLTDAKRLEMAMTPKTKMVWVETPTNPTLKIADLAAIVRTARRVNPGVLIGCDNTFASPINQSPLALTCSGNFETV